MKLMKKQGAFIAISLLAIFLMTGIIGLAYAFNDGYGPVTTPTPPPVVGGEFAPAGILQLLAPYLLVAFVGAAVIASIVIYKKRAK
jgi:hypothetical protein